MTFLWILRAVFISVGVGGFFGMGVLEMAIQGNCQDLACAAEHPLVAIVAGCLIVLATFAVQVRAYHRNQQHSQSLVD